MFKSNNQQEIFSFEDELNQKQGDLLNSSKGKWFYHILFSNINELDFRDLYSKRQVDLMYQGMFWFAL
jgi:hypothetical protein